ncbi:MAG: hypothetical protein WCP36_02430 [Methanomicrobiales archaeon]
MIETIPSKETIDKIEKMIMQSGGGGLTVIGSSGGYKKPRHAQPPEGWFYVDFTGDKEDVSHFHSFISEIALQNGEGRTLEIRVRQNINGEYYRLIGKIDHLSGYLD